MAHRLPAPKVYDPDLDTLHEGVPPWMVAPLVRLLQPRFEIEDSIGQVNPNLEFIERLEMNCRLRRPLDRASPVAHLQTLIQADGSFGIRVIEFVIADCYVIDNPSHHRSRGNVAPLQKILAESGSVYEITAVDAQGGEEGEKRFVLNRRDVEEVKLAITDIRGLHAKAGSYLGDAWKAIVTKDPQPDRAYDRAVKAIEAAAQPVVLPKNTEARLGQIIAAMEDKPEKWTFALGDLEPVIGIMKQLWTTHIRHGTDPRYDHTQEEADAAVHLALPLVRFFASGLITAA